LKPCSRPVMNGSSSAPSVCLIVRSDVPPSGGFDIVDREKHRSCVDLPREEASGWFDQQTQDCSKSSTLTADLLRKVKHGPHPAWDGPSVQAFDPREAGETKGPASRFAPNCAQVAKR
jgi:hypothetical protein